MQKHSESGARPGSRRCSPARPRITRPAAGRWKMGCGSSRRGIQHPLRAPIIPKKAPEKVDPRSGNKYCNDSIVKSWFLEADTDGSGGIDFEEFRKSAIGKGLSEAEAKEVFLSADTDRDGLINYEEFASALSNPESPLANAAARAGMESSRNVTAGMSFPDEPVCFSIFFISLQLNFEVFDRLLAGNHKYNR